MEVGQRRRSNQSGALVPFRRRRTSASRDHDADRAAPSLHCLGTQSQNNPGRAAGSNAEPGPELCELAPCVRGCAARSISLELMRAEDEASKATQALAAAQRRLQSLEYPLFELKQQRKQVLQDIEEIAAALQRADKPTQASSLVGAAGLALNALFKRNAAPPPPESSRILSQARLQERLATSRALAEKLEQKERDMESSALKEEIAQARMALERCQKEFNLCSFMKKRLEDESFAKWDRAHRAEIVCVANLPDNYAHVQFRDLSKRVSFDWNVDLGAKLIDAKELTEGALAAASPEEVRDRDNLVEHNGGCYILSSGIWQELTRLEEVVALSPFKLLRASCGETVQVGSWPLRLLPSPTAFQDRALGLNRGEDVSVPAHLVDKVRPYQVVGFKWLAALSENGLGGLLADDMGLGKTIQVVALLAYLKDAGRLAIEGRPAPALVIVPASLVQNWLRELSRWGPRLRAYTFHGPRRVLPSAAEADVVLTTYETCRGDISDLSLARWSGVVVDEAQRIKNYRAQVAIAARRLGSCAEFRVALTGTPIENRLEELFAIMDFVNPGYLDSLEEFRRNFVSRMQTEGENKGAHDETEERLELLKSLISPFLLRRCKSDKALLPELPERVDYNHEVELTALQRRLYQGTQESFRTRMADLRREAPEDTRQRACLVFQTLNRLRLVCGHPACLSDEPGEDTPTSDRCWAASGKAQRLVELLADILPTGGKVLIFVTRKALMHLLKELVEVEYNMAVLTYSGELSLDERAEVERRFSEEAPCQVLILTTEAGGVGLNLTAASHVVHFDRCYNPAKENQATDRAHRMGQRKVVCVHRLTSQGTFEERLDVIVRKKAALGDFMDGAVTSFISKYSDQELLELFSLGTRAAAAAAAGPGSPAKPHGTRRRAGHSGLGSPVKKRLRTGEVCGGIDA